MSADPRDYKLDLSSRPPAVAPASAPEFPASARPFLSVHFACCGVYTRIYINKTETAYEGFCPKCSRPVRIQIGPGGTDHRFFTAY